MRRYGGNIILFAWLFLGMGVFGQSVESLQSERENLLKEIAQTSKLISQKKASREDYLRQIQLMKRDIIAREGLLKNYQREIDQLDNQIEVNQMLVNDMEQDIERIKREYSRLVQDSYRRKNELSELLFLFSAQHFKEAYLRYRLFKEYSRFRKKQGEVLVESQNKVRGLLSQIEAQKAEKQAVLDSIETVIEHLERSRSTKNGVVAKLQSEEQWLQKKLKDKEAIAQELEDRIMTIVSAEKNVNEDVGESTGFTDRMGKLIWPLQNGVIINPFGKHAHPVLKRVIINNNGIDIQSSSRVDVFCVHSGVVSTVVGIPGLNKAVIVRHGKYLTVYANLVSVTVSKNDLVSAGQIVGRISQESGDMQNVLHFEIWEENRKLDPEQWLRR